MNGERRRPHGRTPRMSAALRRAFEMSEAQADAPHLARLEAVGVETSESEAFLRALGNGDLSFNAIKAATQVVDQMCQGVLGDEDDKAAAEAFHAFLEDLDADSEVADGFRLLLHHTSVIGMIEGFLLGVAYVVAAERQKAARFAARPRR